MIITDDGPVSPLKTTPPPLPMPPSYGSTSTNANSQPPPTYSATPGPSDRGFYQYVHLPPLRSTSAAKRFGKAFLVALGIWALLGIFTRSAMFNDHRPDGGFWSSKSYNIPRDVTLKDCLHVSAANHHRPPPIFSETSETFSAKVPISKSLLLLGSGSLISGKVDIVTSKDLHQEAKFDVTVKYQRHDIAEFVKLCSIQRGSGEVGLGIYTPVNWRGPMGPWDRLTFEVTLTLPASDPLVINNFEADLPNMSYTIEDLQTFFQTLSLKGSNAPIHAETLLVGDAAVKTTNGNVQIESLQARKASVRSSNANIDGSYSSNSTLELITTNGAVRTHVSLIDDTSTTATPLGLRISNSNGRLESTINLISTRSSPPLYTVDTKTTNGNLLVDIPIIPSSILIYTGSTSNAKANVDISSSFEGRFRISTTNSKASLVLDEHGKPEDPAGRGRDRTVDYESEIPGRGRQPTAFRGLAYWGAYDRSNRGNVDIKTTNGEAVLVLQ